MNNEEVVNLETIEFDCLEPITRSRSNTWPRQRAEASIDIYSSIEISRRPTNDQLTELSSAVKDDENGLTEVSVPKRKQATRNAHGSSSYAELITQAITAAKDQRLTLSEIYKWMIEHVPSIKGREEGSGWRNSVRHNLSLHSRFVRVTNENAGQSSWWMINPNEVLAKSSRKRSASMEARKCEKSRARARKKARLAESKACPMELAPTYQQQQQRLAHTIYPDNTNSTSDEPLDLYTHAANQSQSIENRCTIHCAYYGRLSPIPAAPNEAEWASEYQHSYETLTNSIDNVATSLKPQIQISHRSISDNTHEYYHQSTNKQTLTRFNSFLDDVTDIISKEMTDCKLKIK